jgi:hypothetical protein
MPRKKKPKPDDQEQSARFLETAKAVQAEDAKARFEEACEKILKKTKLPQRLR